MSALAADGGRIAFAVGRSASDCDRVRIWTPATGRVVRLGRTTSCVTTSTGTGIASLAIAGTRVLWLHYTGGNIREWRLYTATTARPLPRRLAFLTADVDAPAPIVVGDGDASRLGDILPYAVGRTVIALRANGARRFAWTAPRRVVALSALGGELAVAHMGGRVTVLDAGGRVLREERYAGEIDAVKITGNGLLVQRGRVLELRNAGSPRTWTLPAGSRLEDTAGSDGALYVVGGEARMLSLSGSRDVRLGAAAHVEAEGVRVALAAGRVVRTLTLP
ncbi:MAG: hypothetical protein M3321_02610 [Actinomycetota bacterium]|nr:hypothetical protein [Actinomycetota bacterium]